MPAIEGDRLSEVSSMPTSPAANAIHPEVDPLVPHAVASIEAAEVFSLPFPHIFYRDFFPADFYEELIASLPGDACFERLSRAGTRFAARIYGEHVDHPDLDPSGRWQRVAALLAAPEIEAALRRKLVEGLEIRRKAEKLGSVDDVKLIAKPVIYKDLDGYSIKPHPDTRKKVVTMQVYLPPDDRQREMGTTLYRASLSGLLHVDSYCLEPVKTFPFLPNVGYAFVVLKLDHSLMKTSWHGRPAIKTTIERPRVSVLNTFYSDDSFGF
jgi:hypothetical protein